MDVERGEMVEKELDTLITHRDAERRLSEEDRRVEDLWMPSVRAYAERQAEEKRIARLEYHEGQGLPGVLTLGAQDDRPSTWNRPGAPVHTAEVCGALQTGYPAPPGRVPTGERKERSMTESYEQLRDSATGEAGEAWRRADHEEANLRALYRELKDDPRYTNEHKAQTAWQKYEATREKIAADKEKARKGLAKQVSSGERFSIPMPEGEHLITTDTAKLLASQNEASRIVRKLDRLAASGSGPFRQKPAEVLKGEYERGLELGGVQGGAICRGVLEAADELGLDKNQIVDGFRKESHRNALQDAERASLLSQHIGSQIPEPPFARPFAPREGRDKLLIPHERTIQTKARRPAWK